MARLSVYLLSTALRFLNISVLVCAFLPVLFCLYASLPSLLFHSLFLFLLPLFHDAIVFRIVLES